MKVKVKKWTKPFRVGFGLLLTLVCASSRYGPFSSFLLKNGKSLLSPRQTWTQPSLECLMKVVVYNNIMKIGSYRQIGRMRVKTQFKSFDHLGDLIALDRSSWFELNHDSKQYLENQLNYNFSKRIIFCWFYGLITQSKLKPNLKYCKFIKTKKNSFFY